MKFKGVIWLLVGTCALQSCKKDPEINEKQLATTASEHSFSIPVHTAHASISYVMAPDSISYLDIVPDVVITSIHHTYTHPCNCCGSVPSPSDSVVSYSLDADGDGISDFRITAQTYYAFVSASYPCANYFYNLYIQTLGAGDSVSTKSVTNFNAAANTIQVGAKIDQTVKFSTVAYFHITTQGGGPSYNFIGEAYLPIKMTRNTKTMYGWIRVLKWGGNGLAIKDVGINLTDKNPILAGQKQ